MAITGIVLVVAIVVIAVEVKAQRDFDALAAQHDADFERSRPFYECLIEASAMANKNSSVEEMLAAGRAERECYERYDK